MRSTDRAATAGKQARDHRRVAEAIAIVQHLALSPGREVIALVKAPAVFLLSDPDIRTSVSNHLTGIVSRIHEGPVNAEVVVDLSLTRTRHITSVVTTQAVTSLGLKVGSEVTAAFQATSVILTTFG